MPLGGVGHVELIEVFFGLTSLERDIGGYWFRERERYIERGGVRGLEGYWEICCWGLTERERI